LPWLPWAALKVSAGKGIADIGRFVNGPPHLVFKAQNARGFGAESPGTPCAVSLDLSAQAFCVGSVSPA